MRSMVRWMMLLAPLGLVGCGSDPRDTAVEQVIAVVKDATNHISSVKDTVDKAVKKANESDPKKIDSKAMVKDAADSLDSLKNLTKKMQVAKKKIDESASTVTPEQRDALRVQFEKKVAAAMVSIQEARTELERAIQQAEKLDPESCTDLRSRLSEAEGSIVAR